MSSLLITGAGFVGSWVARELLDLGHKATLFDVAPQMDALRHWVDPEGVPIIRGDLQNIPEILDAIEKSEAEAVLHLASFLTAGVRERPYAGVQVNLMGTVNVLDAPASRGCVAWCSVARQACMAGFRGQYRQGKRRISCSGRLASGPAIFTPFASLPRSNIGFTYRDLYGFDFVALRFGGVYGAWQGAMSGLPGRFVKKIVEPMIQGRPGEFDLAGIPGASSGKVGPTI